MAQYLKPDSELGYIDDVAEIENAKINNLRHTILGCMLGDFDETGAYVVEPQIVKELIEMPKYIVETIDNIEICKSLLKLDRQISFMVTYEGNRATLTLIEKLSYEANFALNSGSYSNINEFVLDSVETSGQINRNVLYQRWNIDIKPGNVIDVFNCDDSVLEKYFGIVNRFKYLLQANKVLIEKETEIEEVEAEYANSIFEILKSYPKFNDAVLNQIKQTLEEKKNFITTEKLNFAKTINELLENTIQGNLSILTEEEKAEFNQQKHNAVVASNIKKAEAINMDGVAVSADSELSPKVNRLRFEPVYYSRRILDLAQDFASAHNVALDKAKTNANNQLQKGILISYIGLKGKESAIQEEPQSTAKAPNLVVGASDKISNAKKTASTTNTKKPTAKKPTAKKPTAKKPAAKKPAAKKPEVKNPPADSETNITKRRRRRRFVVGVLSSVGDSERTTNNNHVENGEERDFFQLRSFEETQQMAAKARGEDAKKSGGQLISKKVEARAQKPEVDTTNGVIETRSISVKVQVERSINDVAGHGLT